MPVTAAEVSVRDVPIYFEGLGTVQASNTVAIHSQVDGKLQSVNFAEGQRVKAGDVLAIVDPRPFQAALDQAKAKKAQDQAQLVSDAKDLARFQDLVKKGAGTQQAVDQQQAKVDALNATIASDQAGIENAETQLSYATITAPISGRVGFRQVDAGNIVHAGDQTPITVLTNLTPTVVVLTLPQRDLASVQDAMAKGEVTVIAMDQDNVHELGKGKLLLIDNQIDQTTSTIRLKASFPNEDERLWPGEFIRARVLVETLKDAVTIPQAAVQRNAQGLLAWVIDPDNTAENRPIEGGPTVDGMTVVKSGLKAGERVVVSGQYRLKPGVKVSAAAPKAPQQAQAAGEGGAMNISAPFINRPVATTLLMMAVAFAGLTAFPLLPVAPLPKVDFPTISVSASLPGASPETMASAVAQPLERQFSQIAGVTQMTSTSTLGATSISLQFELNRNIDAAAQDVQSAIAAAGRQLPTDLPSPPTYRKVNPANSPVLVMGVHSDSLPLTVVDDYADTILAQQISQIDGVSQVSIGGEQKPSVRVQVDPAKLAAKNLTLEDLRSVLGAATTNAAKGTLYSNDRSLTLAANDQLSKASDYADVIVAYRNGAAVRIKDVGEAVEGPENLYTGAWDNSKPAVLLVVFKQPGANVIETVDKVKAALPRLRAVIPPAISVDILSDRTETIRASVDDVEFTLGLTICLVVLVILLFLRNLRVTLIPGLVVPLSLLGALTVMYLCGFSLDNISLMALTISVGFVVDDAIVVVENIYRHIEDGMAPLEAALKGSREIGFTVLSISVSLVAVFIPLLLDGRHRRAAVPRVLHHRDGGHRRLGARVVDPDADAVRALPASRKRAARARLARDRGGIRRDALFLSPHPRRRAAPPLHHAAGVLRHHGGKRLSLHRHPQGLLSHSGHRPHHRASPRPGRTSRRKRWRGSWCGWETWWRRTPTSPRLARRWAAREARRPPIPGASSSG